MNKELAFKYLKYIADMASALERKSTVTTEDVAQLNRELDGFKTKLGNENGFRSEVYESLLGIRFELDERHISGSLLNSIVTIRKAFSVFGLIGLFENKKLNENIVRSLADFKNQLQSFAYRFDEFDWQEDS